MAAFPLILQNGTTADAKEVMELFTEIYTNITNDNIAAGAGIVFSKLDATTVAGVAAVQRLTNKSLTNPTIDDGAGGAGFVNAPHVHSNAANGGTIDHGVTTGRGDDDHTQYSLVDGTRAFTGKVQGVATAGGDAATTLTTKGYVDTFLTDTTHVCYDNQIETITTTWYHDASVRFRDAATSTLTSTVSTDANGFFSISPYAGHSRLLTSRATVSSTNLSRGESQEEYKTFEIVEDDAGVRDVELTSISSHTTRILRIEWFLSISDPGAPIPAYGGTEGSVIYDGYTSGAGDYLLPGSGYPTDIAAANYWHLYVRSDGVLVCRYDMIDTNRTGNASVRWKITRGYA